MVEPGTYSANPTITLKSKITLRGRETARTILSGGGSGTLVSAGGVVSAIIQNFTFASAAVGIDASNNADIRINNNIFTGMTAAAVQILGAASPSARIINNTFFQNAVAISSNTDIQITNNIFSNSTPAAALSAVPPLLAFTHVTNNDFHNSTNIGFSFDPNDPQSTNIPKPLKPLPDPLFVSTLNNPPDMDLHLKEGSPCINQGTNALGGNSVDGFASDIGAFGGGEADTIPFPVTNVNATKPDESTIEISWNPNLSYQVSGYSVYYGKSPGDREGTGAREGESPIDTTELSMALHDLSATATASLTTPALDKLKIQNESLGLSWSAVPGATGYRIYYSTSNFGPDTDTPLPFDFPPVEVDGGDTTSHTLTGLTNNQPYFVAVSAVSKTTYYIAVTALDTAVTNSFIPGQADESAFSKEFPVGLGAASEGAVSNRQNEYPDVILAQPALPNSRQGCFIATAAYGRYSSPQVQALRDFRDAYLLASGPGRAFVEWYYAHSPAAAAWLNAHPGYKPLVRTALAPAVGLSLVMTRTPFLFKALACLLLALLGGSLVHRQRRPSRS
jgi:hypothetical protein